VLDIRSENTADKGVPKKGSARWCSRACVAKGFFFSKRLKRLSHVPHQRVSLSKMKLRLQEVAAQEMARYRGHSRIDPMIALRYE
jgi:hypothetical protein